MLVSFAVKHCKIQFVLLSLDFCEQGEVLVSATFDPSTATLHTTGSSPKPKSEEYSPYVPSRRVSPCAFLHNSL